MKTAKKAKKTLFILVPQIFGILNSACSWLSHLINNSDKNELRCIFYGIDKTRKFIERSGCEYRQYQYNHEHVNNEKTIKEIKEKLGTMLNPNLSYTFKILPSLLIDYETDRPDMIVYAQWFLGVKYLLEVIKNNHQNDPKYPKPPKSVMLRGMPAMYPHIPRDWNDFVINDMWNCTDAEERNLQVCLKFGISPIIDNVYSFFDSPDENMTIMMFMPELQPYLETLDRSLYTYVGPLINEDFRNLEYKILDDNLEKVINMFEPKSGLIGEESKSSNNNLKLIYVSLGTLFCCNIFIYEEILEAIDKLDHSRLKVLLAFYTY